MSPLSTAWAPSPDALRRGGTVVLWMGLLVSIALVLALAWLAPDLLPYGLALTVAVSVVAGLLWQPELHLYAVLLGSATVLQHEPGVQTSEVIYGIYAVFYLVTWAIHQRFVLGHRLLDSAEAWMLALFLMLVVVLIPVSFMYGGTPHTVVRELTSLAFIAFFFPVREACRRSPHGTRVIIGIAMALTLFVVARNVVTYREVLGSAKRIADMLAGRVVANEHMLAAGSLFGVVFLLYATSVREALLAAAVFMASFGGLLLSMSRGFWVSFVWGVCLLFWVVDRKQRVRIASLGALAAVAITAIAVIFFGDLAEAYIAHLLDRIGSVQGSATRDVSILGRIYEGRAALSHIAENPVLGHGAGVPFSFTTILSRKETTTTFVHNGYVYLWYAFGIPGSLLILTFWWRAIGAGLSVFRRADAPRLARLGGLGAAASLFCYTLSAMTSNPFWHKDYLLGFGLLAGIAYGVKAYVGPLARTDAQTEARPPVASP